jgi:hypothetical protein
VTSLAAGILHVWKDVQTDEEDAADIVFNANGGEQIAIRQQIMRRALQKQPNLGDDLFPTCLHGSKHQHAWGRK